MMKELTDIKYVFSEDEFEFLASAANVGKLLCFGRAKRERMTDAEAKKCLFDMSKRGIITADENKIRIHKPFSDLFRDLARCNKTLKIIKNGYITFWYVTEDMNAIEADRGRKSGDYIILENIDKAELKDRISDRLPDNMIPEDILFMKADNSDEGEETVILEISILDNNNVEIEGFQISSVKAYLYLSGKEKKSIYKKMECVERIMLLLEERK